MKEGLGWRDNCLLAPTQTTSISSSFGPHRDARHQLKCPPRRSHSMQTLSSPTDRMASRFP
ncbi:hypothetical protein E2C01_020743 [Portunus trituberculatus]|uniref:Uncharacterized protein n=1 Tax=Portunus trituberculatus TaxID=210409 RepID=A0A5B7E2E6_PORTR|nr:hypothetical protein [Portunus trituberculatus]